MEFPWKSWNEWQKPWKTRIFLYLEEKYATITGRKHPNIERKTIMSEMNKDLEYSQDNETLSMLIKYDGKRFDVRESDNILSLKLAENASQSIEYSEMNEDGFTNLVTVKIK